MIRFQHIGIYSLLLFSVICLSSSKTFSYNSTNFLIDGQPFQIRSGEMHYSRIPFQYWKHRIQMAKAAGLNTISTYIMWNFHEMVKGQPDFESSQRNLSNWIKTVQSEGMYLLIRPGPYICGEWDFGGLPWWLLKHTDIQLRSNNPLYMGYVRIYVETVAKILKGLQITHGGPILMLQVENEYGFFGNDQSYLEALKQLWISNGIDIPFYTADPANAHQMKAGHVSGGIVGIDPGLDLKSYDIAREINPSAPSFSSETYPGWLTHYGENWAGKSDDDALKEIQFLMDNNKSFSSYMIHGGTNFEFWAGANYDENDKNATYKPHVTSYDYNAPITENGLPTKKFQMFRNLILSKLRLNLPPIPDPIPTIRIDPFRVELFASIWDNLPTPVMVSNPLPMEMFDQFQGFILYRTEIPFYPPEDSPLLKVSEVHDFAHVYLNSSFMGTLDRRVANYTTHLPKISNGTNVSLDIFVEAMGRINFGDFLTDRKGITDRVVLSGVTLMNWRVYNLPLDYSFIRGLKKLSVDSRVNGDKKGFFFKSQFNLTQVGDTFIDLSNWTKGVIWVNGYNLGRYWNIGPQQRMYCPGVWLKTGLNEIVIFDLYKVIGDTVSGEENLIPIKKPSSLLKRAPI